MSRAARVIRYSEAFKRQVVAQIEDGTLESIAQARERYAIAGADTIKAWLRRFGREDLIPKVVRVEKPGERDQVKAMKKRIRELEHALAETRMRELLAEGHYLALCRQVGLEDAEGQKKKRLTKPSTTDAGKGSGNEG